MLTRSILKLSTRLLSRSSIALAKGDASTIDAYQLPSQTSINEWEFRYDFIPKVLEPKIPPVTKEAISQDIQQEKVKKIELETFAKEANTTTKVASVATVVSGGEFVETDNDASITKPYSNPELILNNAKKRKFAGSEKYVQSSVNPHVNNAEVVNHGDNDISHKIGKVAEQELVVDDIDADSSHEMQAIYERGERLKEGKKKNLFIPLGLVGVGIGGYYLYSKD